MKKQYHYLVQGVVGNGTAADLVRWIDEFITVLFPGNGIEYWSNNEITKGAKGYLRLDAQVPKAGVAETDLHHVACYVRYGTNEGRVIEVSLYCRNGDFINLCWAKSFGSSEECWSIAALLSEALNDMLGMGLVPFMVDMWRTLPKEHKGSKRCKLSGTVRLQYAENIVTLWHDDVAVRRDQFVGKVAYINAMDCVRDWMKILSSVNCNWSLDMPASEACVLKDMGPVQVLPPESDLHTKVKSLLADIDAREGSSPPSFSRD